MDDARGSYLWDGKTVGGRTIFLSRTAEQNWLRAAISEVSMNLSLTASEVSQGKECVEGPQAWARILGVVTQLQLNLNNEIHFGEWLPGNFSESGIALVPNSAFDYFDLWCYGASSDTGFAGFSELCGIAGDITEPEVLVATGLLLLDAAVEAADEGRDSRAAYFMNRASEAAATASLYYLDGLPKDDIKASLRESFSRAGRLSGEARREMARASPQRVRELADELLAQGKPKGQLANIIASRLHVTPDYVRQLRKKPS